MRTASTCSLRFGSCDSLCCKSSFNICLDLENFHSFALFLYSVTFLAGPLTTSISQNSVGNGSTAPGPASSDSVGIG